MGLTYANIELINTKDLILSEEGLLQDKPIRKTTLSMLVDSGAMLLALPQFVAEQLGLRLVSEGEAELANGKKFRSISWDLSIFGLKTAGQRWQRS